MVSYDLHNSGEGNESQVKNSVFKWYSDKVPTVSKKYRHGIIRQQLVVSRFIGCAPLALAQHPVGRAAEQ
jgi:hypothetical protein